jgi:hypothetical protein
MARKGENAIGVAKKRKVSKRRDGAYASQAIRFLATREERLFSTKRAAETSNANGCRIQSLLRDP